MSWIGCGSLADAPGWPEIDRGLAYWAVWWCFVDPRCELLAVQILILFSLLLLGLSLKALVASLKSLESKIGGLLIQVTMLCYLYCLLKSVPINSCSTSSSMTSINLKFESLSLLRGTMLERVWMAWINFVIYSLSDCCALRASASCSSVISFLKIPLLKRTECSIPELSSSD